MRRPTWALAMAVMFGSGGCAPAPLVVMTFNIRYGTADDGENAWPLRRHTVAEAVRRADPDLLGVQEALKFQLDYLAEQLPEWEQVGVGRDDGEAKGEFSAVLYRRSRFDLLDHGTWWLSETPDVPGSKSWDAALPRIATWTVLRDRASGRELLFACTHFDHRGQTARRNSARLLRERLPGLMGDRPLVLVGDFNAAPGGDVHRALLGLDEPQTIDSASPFLDANEVVGTDRATGTFCAFVGRTSGPRIDWIVLSPDWRPTAARVLVEPIDGRWPSDHSPVVANLDWP